MSIKTEVYVEKKYTPTFTEGEIVVLKKDCYSYSTIANFDELYFKEGRVCKIKKCGLTHFFVNKRGEKQELVKEGEWCLLNVILKDSDIGEPKENFDCEYFLEDCLMEGIIHVNDLRNVVGEDLL